MKVRDNSENLLGYLMESKSSHLQENGSSQKIGLTMEDVIDECKLFYFDGHQTTTNLLPWTMILLCMYPSWQARAREEVLQILGKEKPKFDGFNHLKIVTMILNEVPRLYLPAPFLHRSACRDIKLGEFTYQRRIQFLPPIILIHHDAEHWGEDAHEFKPERFAEGISNVSKSQMAFFPFSGGPRICLGQGFAMIEAKLALSMILQHFSCELSPFYIHAPRSVMTLHPQHGAPVLLQKLH